MTWNEAIERGIDVKSLTWDEAMDIGIDPVDVLAHNDELKESDEEPPVGPHGRVVETRFDPYHDVTVYEDGYEERYYIGD